MPVIAQMGASHNGAVLKATKTPAQNAGTLITLEMKAMKNWGGTSSGAAFVQLVGVETSKYEQTTIIATAEGGADGATHTAIERQGFYFPSAKEVVIIASMDHQDKSNWEVWQASIENTVKDVVKGVIETAKDPKKLIEAAAAAGLIATIV